MEYIKKLVKTLRHSSNPPANEADPDLDLVNVACLGTITCPSSTCPMQYLLHGPAASRSSRHWWSSCWSYNFSSPDPEKSPLNLVITFSRPVNLSEVKLLCGDGVSACPSKVIVKVSTESESEMEMTQYPAYPLSAPHQGSSSELWVSVKLINPQFVKKVLLEIFKPADSDFVYLSQIKLLECVPDPPKQVTKPIKMKTQKSQSQSQTAKTISKVESLSQSQISKQQKNPQFEQNKSPKQPNLTNSLSSPSTQYYSLHEYGTCVPDLSPKTIESYHRFLKLPRYSEVLYGEIFNERARYFIWLESGDAAEYNMPHNNAVDTLPYEVLNRLLEMLPASSEEGRKLRKVMVDDKAINLVLEHLAQTQEQTSRTPTPSPSTSAASSSIFNLNENSSKVWAKGTGYGTGSSWSSWGKGEQAYQLKRYDEEMVICLLNVLNNFFDTRSEQDAQDILSPEVHGLLKNSSLISVVSCHLKNDSVLDIAGHVPLYRMIFQLLRTIAAIPLLSSLLVPSETDQVTIFALLIKMKDAVTTYYQLLQVSKTEDMDLALLMQDIDATVSRVERALREILNAEVHGKIDEHVDATGKSSNIAPTMRLLEDRYVDEMKKLQFAFQEMITDGPIFKVPFHYKQDVRNNWSQAGKRIQSRTKRLAQEYATLSTSLPLTYGSSIFLRCDHDRLDVMKVLITGPADTPYSNGCFEFDIHFPLDYPHSPPMVNFETTGGGRVRFNPNLYANGKVCLSILNTWPGSPEEQWNPKTSSLLLVLVAIQSLIFVEEPYWNEPGMESLGATESKQTRSREYNAQIKYCTLQYAMLDQIRNKSSCFKEVIHRHFWMKKEEILEQCKQWEENTKDNTMDVQTRDPFKTLVSALKNELWKMSSPEGLEDLK